MSVQQPLLQDPFHPTLLSAQTKPLVLSAEQKMYIREVLDIACADSKFSDKAYQAIQFILTSGVVVPPSVTSLVPTSAKLGTPSFTLRVLGKGFNASTQILWNGSPEPTTFVSPTEVTTGVDMSTAQVAMPIPVMVSTPDGLVSNSLTFTLLPV